MVTSERQITIERFIEQEVYACQSALVEEVLKQQLFSVDDIYNIYRSFDAQLIKPSVCIQCKSDFQCLDSKTGECETCFEENQKPQEIFEWWLVSPWLSRKLLLEGEPVLDNDYGAWWGRCITGQAISIDDVIQKIYDDIIGY